MVAAGENRHYVARMNANPSNRKGSALLVTLLVVSLLMVIVLTFTVYVRLELRTVQDRMELQRARQNARLALDLALAKLQLAAGPDQQVTAKADILGSAAEEAKHWTGAWANNLSGGVDPTPLWLVSGTSPDPASGAGSNAIPLFPAVNSGSEVRVPLDPVRNPDNQVDGELAYWVSDEGTKASLLARREGVGMYENPALAAQRRQVEFQSDFGIQLDPFFVDPDLNLADTALALDLERIGSVKDVVMALDSSNDPFTPRESDPAFHDLTPLARGVLENSRDGGLKRNLADLDYRDDFLATDETAAFLGPKGDALNVESGSPGVSEGEPWFSPRPVITEAVLYLGLFHTWSDAKVRIRYHVEAEFLNPYTLPLEFPRDGDSRYTRGVVLVLEGLPEITVRDLSGTGPTLVDDLDGFMYQNGNPSNWRRYINSWIDISADGTPNIPILRPGEVYQVMDYRTHHDNPEAWPGTSPPPVGPAVREPVPATTPGLKFRRITRPTGFPYTPFLTTIRLATTGIAPKSPPSKTCPLMTSPSASGSIPHPIPFPVPLAPIILWTNITSPTTSAFGPMKPTPAPFGM